MGIATENSLAERLDRLELENRWLKRLGGLAIVVMLAMTALGMNAHRTPRRATAEKFVLNDAHGRPRATLGLGSDGAPALSLLDPQGNEQVLLRAANDGSSSLQYFENRSLRTAVSNITEIGASVKLFNRSPRSAAEMFMSEDGSSGIVFHRERRGVGMNVQTDGTSKVSLTDRSGEERAGLQVSPDGAMTNLSKPDRSRNGYIEAADEPTPSSSAAKLQRITGPSQEREFRPRGGTIGKRAFGAP